MEITIVLSLLLLAIILFATEKFSVDIVTLVMLIVLVLTNIITPAEAYAGFSSDFIVILASVFVLGAALEDTGVLEFLIVKLVRVASKSTNLLLALVMLVAGAISAFMNNTTVTAMFVTPLVGVSRKAKISSSKILMPLAYASILGGTCTLIGTSTNVAVSGYLDKAGIEPIGLFEITPIGLILFAVGIIYMMTVGKKLLPKQTNQQDLAEEYNIQKYLTEILVMPASPLIGQNVFTSALANSPFRTLNLIRGKNNFLPDYQTVFQENDILLVEGSLEDLIKIKESKGIEIMADVMAEKDLETKDIRLGELLVTVKSNIIGRTVREIDFMRRYGFAILAISRHGETLRSKINEIELRMGDLLLVQGAAERLATLRSSQNLTILDEFQPILFKKQKGLITICCFLLAILLGSLELVPLSVSFLGAAVISVITKCITTERAYQIIDWRLLILIGGMTAFGTAMENSGAASFLATGIVNLLQDWGTLGILAGFVVLTVFLTQPMSNAAAALVIVPVAIKTALALQVDPRSFAIAIMLAASVSLITPFEPSCILVYGPGKYKFSDFLKVGSGLTLILVALILGLVPFLWPF
ncbi:SLC13 family permease [Adhaeribacter sp. BT258]|uniref:SLC13 family permease n=1 Tax=Adhaeribacter terrigena TaxID=2793070 RepID=A0ABS1C3I5_9BACT|nr:SLC13 family permease [Adhaeribacter terrigena]MBK0403934.1 SLC13 family permease [Adhaeribacter terrigena]